MQARKKVRFIRASVLLKEINVSRTDNHWQCTFEKFSAVDLLIIDDFGLSAMTPIQTEEIYEIIAERHLKGSVYLYQQ